jgi:hypothetical protein
MRIYRKGFPEFRPDEHFEEGRFSVPFTHIKQKNPDSGLHAPNRAVAGVPAHLSMGYFIRISFRVCEKTFPVSDNGNA